MIKRLLLAAAMAVGLGAPAHAQATLDAVRARGTLACGIGSGSPGFGMVDGRGQWSGISADLCRGLAAAILGDPNRVRFVVVTNATRFTATTSGEVDVLAIASTMTALRDTTIGLRFPAIYLYDGHGFMARRDANATDVRGLSNAAICLLQGTTNEQITAEVFRGRNIPFRPLVLADNDQVTQALNSGRCDAFGSDATLLSSQRAALARPDDWVILNERFSKEPYSLVVRRGDDNWFEIVRWYTMALVQAEESGITQSNAEEQRRTATDPNTRRLLGALPEVGQGLRLDPAWAFNAIRAVGNYGEVYDRHFGPNTPLATPRAQNDLWTRGGLLYAPPFR
jgi:general L-amino acid transport system substrate-binding protein